MRVREVFPENIRAIRWHGSSQLGTFSVEPEAPALCAFLYGKDWQPTYKYFVDVRRPSRASNLEEFGARLAALRQGVASRAPLQQIANLPVSLAKEENLRYTGGLSASGGIHVETWITNFRLIVKCSGHNHWAMCEVMIDPSVRVTCMPAGANQGNFGVLWGQETFQRDKMNLISPAPLTNWGSLGPFESLYRNLGVIPSRQVIGFALPGPLIIPAPLSEASSLADRLTEELHRVGRATHTPEPNSDTCCDTQIQEFPEQQPYVEEDPTARFPPRDSVPDDAIQTYAVRLGGPAGPAGALQITRFPIEGVRQGRRWDWKPVVASFFKKSGNSSRWDRAIPVPLSLSQRIQY